MDIRRPSDWAKCNNQEYLGHFRQDKYLDQGHNDLKDVAEQTTKENRANSKKDYGAEEVQKSNSEITMEYGLREASQPKKDDDFQKAGKILKTRSHRFKFPGS